MTDAATRPMAWSIRRELWENRALYIAPPAVAAVFLFGFLLSTVRLAHHIHAAADPDKQRAIVMAPFTFAAGLILMTAFIVAAFYCLDALYGERRDRSILFWKSLPVSDATAVLAKAAIPMVVLPPFIYIVIVATQTIVLLLSTMALSGDNAALALLWTNVKFFQWSVALLYAAVVVTLWYAPIYAWLLLVSAWARRAAFLWAVLPLMTIGIFERMAFGTRYFYLILAERMTGWLTHGFLTRAQGRLPADPLTALAPIKFSTTPGLWIGLVFAAVFLALTVRLRRYRDPI